MHEGMAIPILQVSVSKCYTNYLLVLHVIILLRVQIHYALSINQSINQSIKNVIPHIDNIVVQHNYSRRINVGKGEVEV